MDGYAYMFFFSLSHCFFHLPIKSAKNNNKSEWNTKNMKRKTDLCAQRFREYAKRAASQIERPFSRKELTMKGFFSIALKVHIHVCIGAQISRQSMSRRQQRPQPHPPIFAFLYVIFWYGYRSSSSSVYCIMLCIWRWQRQQNNGRNRNRRVYLHTQKQQSRDDVAVRTMCRDLLIVLTAHSLINNSVHYTFMCS